MILVEGEGLKAESVSELIEAKVILKGSLVTLLFMLLSKPVNWLYYVILGRYLSMSEYGLFFLVSGFTGFAVFFSQIGIPAAISRFTPIYVVEKKWGKVKQVLKVSLKMLLMTSIIISALLVLLHKRISGIYNEPGLDDIIIISALVVPSSTILLVFTEFLRGLKEITRLQVLNLTSSLLKVAVTLALLILIGATAKTAVVALILSSLIVLFLYNAEVSRYLKKHASGVKTSGGDSKKLLSELFSFGLPIFFAGSLDLIFGWTGSLSLGFYRTVSDVGLYGAALTVARIMPLMTSAVSVISIPVLSEMYGRKRHDGIVNITSLCAKWSFYITLPVFVFYVLFPSQILYLTYGAEYTGGSTVLSILALGFLAISFSSSFKDAFNAAGRTGFIFKISLLLTVLNLVLSVLIIPVFGSVGAAAATTASILISALMFVILGRRFIGLRIPAGMWKPFAAALAFTPIVMGLNRILTFSVYLKLPALFITGLAVYFLALILLRGFDKLDIELFNAIVRKIGFRK